MEPLRVALDVGPEHGHRTGVGVTVHELRRELDRRDDVEVVPYLLSWRTRPTPPVRRLPLPAGLAHRMWARVDQPQVERFLGPLDVVHGTNYVVPPSARPRLVSVYDCWFLAHPDQATPTVRRAGAVLRRAVEHGAFVHASSHATADRVRELLGTDRVAVVPLGPLGGASATDRPPPDDLATPDRAATAGPGSIDGTAIGATVIDAGAVEVGPGAVDAGAGRAFDAGTVEPGALPAVGGRQFVLALGTLERRKNVPALTRAFAAATGPGGDGGLGDLHLVLAGAEGDDADAVTEAIAELDPAVRRRIVRTGPVSAATKAWLLHHARLLAYPSLDEGFGFPLLEAQQAGVPIVATRAGSIPEVGGAGVHLVDVGDHDALAGALAVVATDDDRRAVLVTAGRRNLERFSWAETATAIVTLYRRLVDERT